MGVKRLARALLPVGALLLLVAAVFHAAPQARFLNHDDGSYVTENPMVRAGLGLAGVRWAFTTFHAANWHPLTWLSHMLDCTLFGLDPGRHHLTSLLLHAANTLLWFLLWEALTGRRGPSLVLAALCGVHPLHVESALWIAERKDLLSTFFGLIAVLCYRHYVDSRRVAWYTALLGAYALSLLSKPMLVTLPLLLLLLDYWPLGRLKHGTPAVASNLRLLWEKVPLFVLATASGLVTLVAQRAGGAVKSLAAYPLEVRVENALVSYAAYVGRTFVPTGLSVFYPHPAGSVAPGRLAVAAALVLVTCAAAWFLRRPAPFLLAGWSWYLVSLLPVIGIIQVGNQAAADRYTYLPLVGILLPVVWGAEALAGGRRWGPAFLAAAAVGGVVALGVRAERRVADWRDSIRLFESALVVDPGNWLAHEQLGLALVVERGQLEEAVAHYREAIRLMPVSHTAHNFLGVALGRLGRRGEALNAYQRAVALKPDYAEAWFNLGLASLGVGDVASAAAAVGTLERVDRQYALRLAAFVKVMARPATGSPASR